MPRAINASSISGKTIRPGSLRGYSYYYSNRQPANRGVTAKAAVQPNHRKSWLLLAITVLVVGFVWIRSQANQSVNNQAIQANSVSNVPVAGQSANRCAGNNLDKL